MALLMVASAVGLAVRWVRVPYSIALVIVGLIIGAGHILPPVAMTPELILLVCLPALLFEASWNLEIRELLRDWRAILLLAVPGVLIATAIAALLMHSFAALDWPMAFLFGAMTAATDPISVLALFRKLGVDKRLSLILEAESLFNDGTAVVVFKLVLAFALAATVVSSEAPHEVVSLAVLPQLLWGFIYSVSGGAVVGLAVGFGSSYVTKFFEDHLLEITLTTITAYGSYLLADQLDVSAVIAVLMAGIVVGNYGSRVNMTPTTREAVDAFWEYAAFLVNSIVFLLIGMQIDLPLLAKYSHQIFAGIIAILLARVAVVYVFGLLIPSRGLPLSLAWKHMLFWGALRGSLSMALALSLPVSYNGREEVIVITFGAVLFTLIVPGLSIEPLAKMLHLTENVGQKLEVEKMPEDLQNG